MKIPSLTAFLIAVIAWASLSAMSAWTPIADKLNKSVAFLEVVDKDGATLGSCSAFSIDAKRHYFLTAGHCDNEKVTVDGTPAFKMFKDERKDLLVLRVSNVDRPALKLAEHDPERGDEVASLGYGFALEQPLFRIAHVSNTRLEIEGLSGPFLLLDAGVIGGQSGCPIVNQAGEVVGIVQRGAEGLGLGVGATVIKDKTGRFWADDK